MTSNKRIHICNQSQHSKELIAMNKILNSKGELIIENY